MKFYNQTALFQVLISAAQHPTLIPDPTLLRHYKAKRLQRATKALRSKNVFLYTEGLRTSVNLNDITTIYTQPAGARMLLVGYSDNFRYGSTRQSDNAGGGTTIAFPQMHRVRIVGREGRDISVDYCPAQAGVSGQPRYTSTLLPTPVIIEPDEQIAVDLGYDTAATAPTQIPTQAFIFFCVKIRDRLSSLDLEAVEEIKTYITNHDYQRGIFLNCESIPNRNNIEFDTAVAGGVAFCSTRPANGPLLITCLGTTLRASKIVIVDTLDDYSFSLNQPMRTSAVNVPGFYTTSGLLATASPAGAPIWTRYFEFAVPHLLRPGAKLRAEIVNGGIDSTGTAVVDDQTGNVLMFQGITV